MFKWAGSGGCLLVALFCCYGFLASGEYEGTRELAWKTAYALMGTVSMSGAVIQAIKGK